MSFLLAANSQNCPTKCVQAYAEVSIEDLSYVLFVPPSLLFAERAQECSITSNSNTLLTLCIHIDMICLFCTRW